jgi:hypothetical protein
MSANPTAPTGRDVLKMAGLDGTGRPAPRQGVILDHRYGPQNRAQRRLFARLKRRKKLP